MTVQQVADRLVDLCRRGENETAVRELYADHAESHEMPGVPGGDVSGKDAILKKGERWEKDVAEVLKMEVTDPLVYGDFFTCGMGVQVKKKDGTVGEFEQEICVYRVEDGKIVSERFVYEMPDMG